jgi:hypothetical protein
MLAVLNSVKDEIDEGDDHSEPFVITPKTKRTG